MNPLSATESMARCGEVASFCTLYPAAASKVLIKNEKMKRNFVQFLAFVYFLWQNNTDAQYDG